MIWFILELIDHLIVKLIIFSNTFIFYLLILLLIFDYWLGERFITFWTIKLCNISGWFSKSRYLTFWAINIGNFPTLIEFFINIC